LTEDEVVFVVIGCTSSSYKGYLVRDSSAV